MEAGLVLTGQDKNLLNRFQVGNHVFGPQAGVVDGGGDAARVFPHCVQRLPDRRQPGGRLEPLRRAEVNLPEVVRPVFLVRIDHPHCQGDLGGVNADKVQQRRERGVRLDHAPQCFAGLRVHGEAFDGMFQNGGDPCIHVVVSYPCD